MKATKFDEIVAARAGERVQNKIFAFKVSIKKACGELVNNPFYGYHLEEILPDVYRNVLNIMASDNIKKGWPSSLWGMERELVASELLNIMDEMQKAMLAADRQEPGENTPRED